MTTVPEPTLTPTPTHTKTRNSQISIFFSAAKREKFSEPNSTLLAFFDYELDFKLLDN